jgi:hypothetical protein
MLRTMLESGTTLRTAIAVRSGRRTHLASTMRRSLLMTGRAEFSAVMRRSLFESVMRRSVLRTVMRRAL